MKHSKLFKSYWRAAAMLLLLTAVPLTASAYDFKVDGIAYDINGDNTSVTVTFTASYDNNNYCGLTTAIIPSSVTYDGATYSVTAIGESAFDTCPTLTSVTIPNSVIFIARWAFYACSSLSSVTIGNSVISIGEGAFYDCRGLTNITIPNSVTSIGDWAFRACNNLTSLTIPNSVIYIGHYAFYECNGLISVTIPNSVTSIGSGAFYYCSSLASIDIPNSVTSIGNEAFAACSSLTSIIIPNSVTSIGSYAFVGCSGLDSVTIPNSVTSIGGGAFTACNSLASLTLSGYGAWYYNSNSHEGLSQIIGQINTVNIGSGITSLGNFGFNPNVVNCYAEVPPTCSLNTFSNYDGELHVSPTATIAYIIADYWQNFNSLANDLTDKVTLNKTNASLIQWETLALTATINSNGNELVWSTTNPLVGTVDENGVVMAIKEGECDIFATLASNPAVYACCHITIAYPEISISLSEVSLEMYLGDEQMLTTTITPDNTGLSPTWASSDNDIATVVDGKITAISEGECDITANVLDKSATCHVTVLGNVVITLDQHELELDINHIAILTPSFTPIVTDLSVASSDPSVVIARKMTQNGTQKVQLVGMKQGVATVTVESVDGKAVPDSCVVTVIRRVGDIDGDGYINVMDITSLIDVIMNDGTNLSADVNGDGDINVMDITALIDIIMNS